MKNYRLRFFYVVFTCLLTHSFYSQTSDLARIEYLHIPNSKAGNQINRYRLFVQFPLKLSDNNYLVLGGDYRYVDLDLQDMPFDVSELGSVQLIEGNLGFIHRTDGEWIYAARVGLRLASNFNSKIVPDDYIYITNAYAIRDRTDKERYDIPSRLIFGIEYTTTAGRNFPLPILNYYREFHPKWTYTLGAPKTNIRYKIHEKHHVQSFVTLDNFFANIQNNVLINGRLAENVSTTIVLGGIGYEYYFTDHLLYYGYAGYSILNDYRFRDNERDEVFVIEDRNTFYFRTGIKFKI